MKLQQIPKIYPITDVGLTGLSHVEQVRQFIHGGATLIQLREKKNAPREFYEEACEAVELAGSSGVQIIINDRVDIALASRAAGVHLGQTDLPAEAARQILGKNAIIGLSTHNLEQAVAAVKLPIDYVALGPIFATTTKQNPDTVVGLENLKPVRAAIGNFPIVAIGGITKENAEKTFAAGASSLAIISALFEDKNKIAETTRKFLAI